MEYQIGHQNAMTLHFCSQVAIMIGSSIFSLALSKGWTPGQTLQLSLGLLSVSTAVCAMLTGPNNTLFELKVKTPDFISLSVKLFK